MGANDQGDRGDDVSDARDDGDDAIGPAGVERLRAALAELEDAKLRVQRSAEDEAHRLRIRVLEQLIPVLANLDRSIAAAEQPPGTADQALLEGLRHVHNQFLSVLAGFGLERLSAIGARFDPHRHDAVALVPVDDPADDGIVIDELQPGYVFGDVVVSPARVQVGRAARREAS